MTISKLVAGVKGSPANSRGSDVANSVNALIDSNDDVVTRLIAAENQLQDVPPITSGVTPPDDADGLPDGALYFQVI